MAAARAVDIHRHPHGRENHRTVAARDLPERTVGPVLTGLRRLSALRTGPAPGVAAAHGRVAVPRRFTRDRRRVRCAAGRTARDVPTRRAGARGTSPTRELTETINQPRGSVAATVAPPSSCALEVCMIRDQSVPAQRALTERAVPGAALVGRGGCVLVLRHADSLAECAGRRCGWASALLDAQAGNRARNHQLLDLTGALEDGVNFRVAVHALDVVLARVPVAT